MVSSFGLLTPSPEGTITADSIIRTALFTSRKPIPVHLASGRLRTIDGTKHVGFQTVPITGAYIDVCLSETETWHYAHVLRVENDAITVQVMDDKSIVTLSRRKVWRLCAPAHTLSQLPPYSPPVVESTPSNSNTGRSSSNGGGGGGGGGHTKGAETSHPVSRVATVEDKKEGGDAAEEGMKKSHAPSHGPLPFSLPLPLHPIIPSHTDRCQMF